VVTGGGRWHQRTGAPANYCCFELGEALCFGSGYACEPGQLTASPLGEFDWLLKKVKNMDPELIIRRRPSGSIRPGPVATGGHHEFMEPCKHVHVQR